MKSVRRYLLMAFLAGWIGGITGPILIQWTYTYNTTTPLGSDAPSSIDDRIREVKQSIQERENIDHYWALTTNQVSDANSGKHRQITLKAAISTPTLAYSPEAAIYSKTVSGKPELCYISKIDGNEVQVTSGKYLKPNFAPDSIGANLIQLANNTYLNTLNAAGSGEVSLIKADANNIPVLPDGAQTATNAAPTMSKGIPNKKYVDDKIAAVPTPVYFGSWASKSDNTVYQAATDGIVVASNDSHGDVKVYTNSSNPPTTMRAGSGGETRQVTCPVKKSDYWKVTGSGTTTVYWIPLGS